MPVFIEHTQRVHTGFVLKLSRLLKAGKFCDTIDASGV